MLAIGMFWGGWELRNRYKLQQADAAIVKNSLDDIKTVATLAIINRYFNSNNKKTTLLHQAIIQRPDDSIAHSIIGYITSISNIDSNKPEKIVLNGTWIDGPKPIHSAVERGNVHAIEALIKASMAIFMQPYK